MIRLLRNALLSLLILCALLGLLAWKLAWHPEPRQAVPVACSGAAPPLEAGQTLKVMTWNVQYLAGKNYTFWYEQEGGDDRPSFEDLAYNLDEVSRVIRDEHPDIVLLQELDNGAKATDYQDQLALLRERVVDLYPCSVQAYDWKADFVPNLHIFGAVGRTLATLSRYPIKQAERLELPRADSSLLTRLFQPHPTVLASYLPLQDGGQLAVLNTRLERHIPGQDIQRQQVQVLEGMLDKFESQGTPWLLGGDFNLLPLGQHRRLTPVQRGQYSPDSELHLLWDKYPMIPSNPEASGAERADWFTHFPNDPTLQAPDRTVDYLFHSPRILRQMAQVRQNDSLRISDHLPLLARFQLPPKP